LAEVGADDLLLRVAEDLAELLVALDEASAGEADRHPDRGVLERRVELLLALAQLLLGQPELGDVDAAAGEAERASRPRIALRHAAREVPPVGAVLVTDADLALPFELTAIQERLHVVEERALVLGMDQGREPLRERGRLDRVVAGELPRVGERGL